MGQSVKAVLRNAGFSGLPTGGWVGLTVISIVSGLVAGIAEALGASSFLLSLRGVRLTIGKSVQILVNSMIT